jgi:hypothetical protein
MVLNGDYSEYVLNPTVVIIVRKCIGAASMLC